MKLHFNWGFLITAFFHSLGAMESESLKQVEPWITNDNNVSLQFPDENNIWREKEVLRVTIPGVGNLNHAFFNSAKTFLYACGDYKIVGWDMNTKKESEVWVTPSFLQKWKIADATRAEKIPMLIVRYWDDKREKSLYGFVNLKRRQQISAFEITNIKSEELDEEKQVFTLEYWEELCCVVKLNYKILNGELKSVEKTTQKK